MEESRFFHVPLRGCSALISIPENQGDNNCPEKAYKSKDT